MNLNDNRRKIFKSIYIDGSFLFKCVQNMSGVRIDYRKLISVLVHPGELLQSVCYYTALPNEYDMEEKHRNFLKVLKKDVKIRVRSVPLKTFESNNFNLDDTSNTSNPTPSYRYSKGEDILLACDLVRGAYCNHWDFAVIVTGDADYIPAIHSVQDAGKHITVASFHNSLSQALEMEANDVIYLDEYLDRIKL